MTSTAPTGHANQACQRCYGRKKKCDKSLPRCKSCAQASVECSFEEASNETGVFQVSYVRALEDRVRQLKEELLVHQSASSGDANSYSPGGSDYANYGFDDNSGENPFAVDKISPTGRVSQYSAELSPSRYSSSRPEGTGSTPDDSGQEIPESFESGLELLSLEASAERYLGSSSGVTFARLTQAVLKRLKPDLQPFTFYETTRPGAGIKPERKAGQGSNQAHRAAEASVEEGASSASPSESEIALPDKDRAYQLAEYYWNHSHTLYPFVRKASFMESLRKVYADPDDAFSRSSHSWLYTMWMVFAIGSTSLSTVMIADETESIRYWNAAMGHFDGTLEEGNMAALHGILLQVSYSFFNQVGPNIWYLVGVGIRLALGMGLHTNPTTATIPLPRHVQEYRSRLFFSLYMMDRLVSITLGRPFGIRDEDIEVEPFAAADDADILSDRILRHRRLTLPATAVPLHILAIRKLGGEIFQEIYSNKNRDVSQTDRNAIIRKLHEKLIQWRRNMPFPLPESQALRVPHLTSTWYDLNYHNHVIMIYRPSPLCRVITVEMVTILADASAMSIRHVATLHRQQRFSFNWLNLFSVFTTTLALIYTITAQPEPISTYLQRSDALVNLRLAAQILQTFSEKFPSALKYCNMVQDVISRLEAHLPASVQAPGTSASHLLDSAARPSAGMNVSAENSHQQTFWSAPSKNPTLHHFLAPQTPSHSHSHHSPSIITNQSSSWPPQVIDRPEEEINLLSTNENYPLALQLSQMSGLFDDLTGQDLVSGFDMMGQMDLDEESFSYYNTGFGGRKEGGARIR